MVDDPEASEMLDALTEIDTLGFGEEKVSTSPASLNESPFNTEEKPTNFIVHKEIDYVDLRFTDPRGKLQHVTMDAKMVDEDMLNDGVFFDGSSIAGWKAINESDMILKPDLDLSLIHISEPTRPY